MWTKVSRVFLLVFHRILDTPDIIIIGFVEEGFSFSYSAFQACFINK